MKQLERKLITYKELQAAKEHRKRVFIVSYVNTMKPAVRKEKMFQQKRNVNKFLENRKIEKVKLYIGDVIEQTRI